MADEIKTTYDKSNNAHIAVINPPYAAIEVTVHIDKYDSLSELDELFLYNFDVDSNAIEFAFGEKIEDVEFRKQVKYSTDPAIHVPPFRIQITHQLDTVNLENYEFTVSYSLKY
jgi:hypothetical protein